VRQITASEIVEASNGLDRRCVDGMAAEVEPRHERIASGMFVSFHVSQSSDLGFCDFSIFDPEAHFCR
jgi:hypothetical protein